jgi:hypothetical protein
MNLSHRFAAAILAAAPLLLLSVPAHAMDFEFTIVGVAPPPGSSLYGRIWEPGTLTGIVFGLQDNTLNQTPTAVTFLSGYAPVGLTKTTYTAAEWSTFASPGFDVAAGQITDVSFRINFTDPVEGGRIFTINSAVIGPPVYYNSLAWNGLPVSGIDNGRRPGVGNGLGMPGATFAVTAAVPEPGSFWLLGMGIAALAGLTQGRAKDRGNGRTNGRTNS